MVMLDNMTEKHILMTWETHSNNCDKTKKDKIICTYLHYGSMYLSINLIVWHLRHLYFSP